MSYANPSDVGFNWWDKDIDDDQRFVSLATCLQALRTVQSGRITSGLLYESTYEQQNVFGGDASGGMFPITPGMTWDTHAEIQLLTFNVMQIAFDTLCSKLEQSNGKVKFQTDGGNWEQQQKAIQLEKLVAGEFYRLKFYEVKAMVMLDMLLHGTGYIKFYCDPVTHRPCLERWHPLDVFFDEVEARDAPPLTMYTTRIVSKQVLKTLFPKLKDEIDRATLNDTRNVLTTRGINILDAVEIIEAWRLPTAEGAGDGMHILGLSTCTLECGPWTRMDFPFARFDWVRRRRGPYSVPAAEQVIFLQRNLNRLIQRQAECLYMLSFPYILAEESAEVNPAHFESDGVGVFITFRGPNPPQMVVNKVVPDDIRITIQETIQQIYSILGINGLESVGNKPAGLDSAPAIAQFVDQSSLRHLKTVKSNERFILQCSEKLLEEIRDIRDEYGDYEAFGEAAQQIEKIKFTDADLPPNAYVMKMELANLLSDTPAGRIQQVQQLADTGAFTPTQIIKLLRSPDVDAATSDITSTEQDIDWTIYEMTKLNGRYLPPEESQDLALGVTKVNNAFLAQRRQGAPDAVLLRLARWRDTATAILQRQQQAQMQQQMQMQQQVVEQQLQGQAALDNNKAQATARANIAEKQAEAEIELQKQAVMGPPSTPSKK